MPYHRRSSPPVLTLPVLIILLPIITFLFLLFAIPPFLALTSHIFRPIAVKKSWDLLNIFLVLFAILCGIFARRNDDESANNDVDSDVVPDVSGTGGGEESEPVNPQRWFGYSEDRRSERIFDSVSRSSESGGLRRLKRSSSSYPDLRQESLWETRDDQRFPFRFLDDFDVYKYRATAAAAAFDHQLHEARAHRRGKADDGEAKEIPVDTFVVRPTPSPPPKSPSPATPPPPPPPPPSQRHKPKRTYRTVGERKEKVERQEYDHRNVVDQLEKVRSPPPTPPPPPPRPPPSPARIRPEQKKLERRKSNVKKEIAMALTSLYKPGKRKKKQKIASSSDQDYATSSPPEQTRFPPPSPPPPPPLPPPPSSVFHNLFKKGSKIKRIHTVPPPPPPPPLPISSSSPSPSSRSSKHKDRSMPPPAPPAPPPLSSLRPSKHKNRSTPPPAPPMPPLLSSSSSSKHKNRTTPPPVPPTPPPPPAPERWRRTPTPNSGGRPPLPARSANCCEKNVNSGSQSPLIPMPPQPPPFKTAGFNFVVRGDYVRIRSAQSSPELEDVDRSSTKVESETVMVMDGGDGVVAGAVTCPSPDVNIKADNFIARLHDGWRLEKINSLREKQKI